MPPKRKFEKEQIIDAAFDLLREHGLESVSAREIAKKLNCSSRPIFTFYSSMEELKLDAVFRACNYFWNTVFESGSPTTEFKDIGMGYLEFAKDEPELFKTLFMNARYAQYTFGDIFKGIETSETVKNIVSSSSGLDEKKSVELYKYLWMFSHAIATLGITGIYKMSDEESAAMLDDVYDGLCMKLKNESENGEIQ